MLHSYLLFALIGVRHPVFTENDGQAIVSYASPGSLNNRRFSEQKESGKTLKPSTLGCNIFKVKQLSLNLLPNLSIGWGCRSPSEI
jgi:hypothetical protein